MGSNTSLFFQIATGLIPLLLVGGARSGLTNELKAAQPSARRAAQVLVTILAPAVVVAEFFAISEAVSADLSPPLFRTVFVAEILTIETVLLAVGFLLPWFEGWAAAATLAVIVVIAGTVVAGALGTPH